MPLTELKVMNTAKLAAVLLSSVSHSVTGGHTSTNVPMAGFLSSTALLSDHLAATYAQQFRPLQPCTVARNRQLIRRRDIKHGSLLLEPEHVQVHRRTPRSQTNLYSRRAASVNHLGEWRQPSQIANQSQTLVPQ